MAVVEIPRPAPTKRDRELLARLVEELRSPTATGQPLIEIREMARGARHVHVIWDAWETCASASRNRIVRAAFREVKGEDYEKSILITVPATMADAAESGMLPFQVKPLSWDAATNKVRDTARTNLLELGGSVVGDPPIPALHFRTMDAAQAALRTLRDRIPKLDWYVLETRFGQS